MTESYTNERIVGHRIKAEEESDSKLLKNSHSNLPQYIRITEGDVDWEETREVRITKQELEEMAEKFL